MKATSKMIAILVALASLSFAATNALAETLSRQVRPGETVQVWRWAHFTKECKSTSPAIISWLTQPAKGKITVKRETFAVNPIHRDWAKCKGKKLPGIVLYYTAARNAAGGDRFRFVQDPSRAKPGEIRVRRDVTVNVAIR